MTQETDLGNNPYKNHSGEINKKVSIFDLPQAVIAAAFQVDEVVIRYETPEREE